MDMRHLTLALLGSVSLAACGQGADEATTKTAPVENTEAATTEVNADAVAAESERLNQWFAERWEEELDFSPMFKTYLGRKDDQELVDDVSEAAEDRQLEWRRDAVAKMKSSFDYDSLTPEAQTSYDIFAYQLDEAEAEHEFRRRHYVFHQMYGPHADLSNFLINFHSVETAEDMDAYITRIGGISVALEQSLERAKIAASEGVRPPRFAYDGVIKQSRALIDGAPFEGEGDAPLWADAKRKIDTLLAAGAIDEEQAETMRGEAREALVSVYKPTYDAVIAWFESDIENSDENAKGVGSLPQGKAFYEERLAHSTTTDMTADEVHQLGLDEVARIRTEMEAIKEKVGFEGTLQEFFDFVREDEQFYYPNTDEGRQAYIDAADAKLAYIKDLLPDYFGILPKADLVVKRVEAFRERDGGAQHYYPGTPDGSRPGIYYAHLSDMGAMPIPQLEVIAYHEGLPGHHMQLSIAQELTGVPEFRTQAGFTAYSEGWGLYSELLAKEMGAYDDPYSDFGRLTTEIWRAIRLVLDTGIHAKGWTQEQAVDYFIENSPAAEGQIRSEVMRYIVMPGQATAYKIGMLKILELRAEAKEALGDDFDIKGFHDTVLGGGALPLSVLERRVDRWVEDQKAS
ncbi:DUF885 domain-containing protein [Hyphococcus sp. ECK-19]|uniref:DUF885 domain-containing protein n=2 Tax=Hyphococcus lacteus TaxID=3143536 RepID=A0ABV3Z7X5_9PROT